MKVEHYNVAARSAMTRRGLLKGAAGVSDVHLHPTEPRSFRVALITTF